MEDILHMDYLMDWEDKFLLNNSVTGEGIESCNWALTTTNLWTELNFFLQELSILSYNKLNISYYKKTNGLTEVLLVGENLDDDLLNFEENTVEYYLKNHFSRITDVSFERIQNNKWHLTILESLD